MKQVRTPLLALFILIGLGAATAFTAAEALPESSSTPQMITASDNLPEAAIGHDSIGDSLTGSQSETMDGANGGGDLAGTCEESWYCTSWICKEDGTMTRTCFERNKCGTILKKPAQRGSCEYSPLCQNGVVDEREEGLDCGGACPPCYTCHDHAWNQGEEGIDCGGPCDPCPDCHDGEQNQGETGIDCGGPCPECGSCEDGMLNQDESEVDRGGSCGAILSEEQAGKINDGNGPFRFLAAIAAGMTLLMVNMVVTCHFGKGVFHLPLIRKKVTIPTIPAERKEEEAKTALAALNNLSSRHHSARDIDALRSTVRQYLAGMFGLHESFNPEEFATAMDEWKIDPMLKSLLVSYLNKIGEVSYAGKAMHAREFQSLIKEAQELVQLTAPRDRELRFESRPRKVSIRVLEESDDEAYRLIAQAYDALMKGDPFLASEYYHKALGIYEKRHEEDKEDLYDSIKRLHAEINLFENVFAKK